MEVYKAAIDQGSGTMKKVIRGLLLFTYLFSLGGWCGGVVVRICEDGRFESGGSLFGCDADDDAARETGGGRLSSARVSCDDALPFANYLNEKNSHSHSLSVKQPYSVTRSCDHALFLYAPAGGYKAPSPLFSEVIGRQLGTVFLLL